MCSGLSVLPMSPEAMQRLIWVDCEMTGLDLQKDTIMEIAVVVTEGTNLQEVRFLWLYVCYWSRAHVFLFIHHPLESHCKRHAINPIGSMEEQF